jgi:hypothetical protein
MKRAFIICTLFLSLGVSAQEKISMEEGRFFCAELMASFTQAVSEKYQAGMNYEEFQSALCGKWQPVDQGREQLKTAYLFLEKGVAKDDILRSYSGNEIANSLQYLAGLNKRGNVSDGAELFGGVTESIEGEVSEQKCKWYQLWCHVKEFANWLVQNWEDVSAILEWILRNL